ncbi:MAG: hypothetical protein KBS96_03185 [Lachnospiraceae bacterium]|nr:hypothetical protein [Candidatus Colinaster scatohippi]
MTENEMIEDLINQLDSGMSKGVGHVNVYSNDSSEEVREVETMGCTDCSRTPLACSVPTLHQGIDDYQ